MLKIITLISLIILTGCAAHSTNPEGMPMSKLSSHKSLDMRGKTITPFILYHANQQLGYMNEGELLEISTDRFEAIENDLRAWGRMTGYEIVDIETGSDYQRYHVKKSVSQNIEKKLAMVISEAALEKLIAPLGVAVSAALSGADVHLFSGTGSKGFEKKFQGKTQRPW